MINSDWFVGWFIAFGVTSIVYPSYFCSKRKKSSAVRLDRCNCNSIPNNEQFAWELIGEISNSLQTTDAIELGKTNKQFNANSSKIDFGYKVYHPVNIETIFDDYTRRKYVIGNFKHVLVQRLDDLSHLQTLWSSLTHLTFETFFKQSVNNIKLPTLLTHLTFGHVQLVG